MDRMHKGWTEFRKFLVKHLVKLRICDIETMMYLVCKAIENL